MSKLEHEPRSGSVHRLVRGIWWLGPWLGWRYWRLENRAKRDPRVVPAWCDEMERQADKDYQAGRKLEAAHLRFWAAQCRYYNERFHSANSSGELLPPKTGKELIPANA
jgi:hypothetical protein